MSKYTYSVWCILVYNRVSVNLVR